jgi:ribonuclease HI
MRTVIYTDGSVTAQRKISRDLLATWAFVVVGREKLKDHRSGEVVHWRSGWVETDFRSEQYVGAEKHTNNTAELSAIYWALFYLHRNGIKEARLYSDSLYSIRAAQGGPAGKNRELIKKIRELYIPKPMYRLRWVKGHAGFQFNELADRLAKAQQELCKKTR